MQCTLNSHIIWSMLVPSVYICYHLCPHISYTLIIKLQAQSFKKGICVNTPSLEESGFVNYFLFLKYHYSININRAGIAQNIHFFSTKTYIKLGEKERGTKASLVQIWRNNMSLGLSQTRRTWGKRYCGESHASWTLSFQLAWNHCWALSSYSELSTVSDKCNCWHCCTRYLWRWEILQVWKELAEMKEFQQRGCRMAKKPTVLHFTLLKYGDQTYRKNKQTWESKMWTSRYVEVLILRRTWEDDCKQESKHSITASIRTATSDCNYSEPCWAALGRLKEYSGKLKPTAILN